MEDEELRQTGYLKRSVQRAMIGEITANLAGLHATLEQIQIIITGYFFNEPTEDDLEHLSLLATSVIADYPAPFTIDERTALIAQTKINATPWNFLRAEAS